MSWISGKRGRGPDRKVILRFGVFVVFTVVLTFYIGQQILATSFNDRYELTATFDDVAGLFEGDLVKVAGTPVGRVNSIEVKDGRAEIGLEVDEQVRLPVDSTASVRWRNMLGQRIIYLEPGRSGAMLGDGARVRHTRSVVDLAELINDLGPMTRSLDPNQINQVLNAFAQTLDGNTGNINLMIQNLDVLLRAFAQRKQTIEGMLRNYKVVSQAVASRDKQIAASVDNLQELTRVFARNEKLLDAALVELGAASTDLNTVLGGDEARLSRIVDNFTTFSETARKNLDELEEMVQKLPLTLRQLFAAGNGGHYMRVNALCLNIVPMPCPFPMQLPPTGGYGGKGRQPSPAELAKLKSMLQGGR